MPKRKDRPMPDGLAEFQVAAVDRIVERLTDPKGSHRFLLADEVGLGKTRVAAGVITTMMEPKRNGFTVVYVCSNSEIAEQNRDKLCPDTQSSAVTRLTLLATRSSEVQRQRDKGDLQLFSFTPGTSFHVGGATGIDRERQLLLYLLARIWGKRVNRAKWRRFFCCTCKWEDKLDPAGYCIREGWSTRSRFGDLRHEFIRKLAKDLQQRLRQQWNACTVEIIDPATQKPATKRLAKVIDGCVDAFACDQNKVTSKNRNRVIGALRHGLSQVALEFLQPDLVVLDEFQRFSEVLEESNKPDSIVGRLFAQKGMAALILSATPYKMYTQAHEDEDHYKEFIRTLRFLYNCHCVGADPADCTCPPVKRLRENLNRFKTTLSEGKWFTGPDQTLLDLKTQIETDLKAVMCRTERNWYLEGHKKGVEELGAKPQGVNPSPAELTHYVRLRQFLLQQKIDDWNIMDFWKSAPSPLSFMDAHYALVKRLRDRHVPVPPPLLQSGGALSAAGAEHLKVRTLTDKVLGSDSSKLKFLWVKPSYAYYADEFYHKEDPAKFLVFSHWKFVPKAISVLLSHEVENRLVTRRRGRDTIPLAFRPKISFSPFDVCYPSPALADCVDPAELALERAGKWTANDLYRQAEQAVRKMLASNGIDDEGKTRSVPLWRIIARIEAKSPHADTIHRGLWDAEVVARDEVSEQYRQYQEQYSAWMAQQDEALHISPYWLRRLTLIALYSPAVCLLRSMRSVFGHVQDWEHNNWSDVLKLGLNQLRNYFNKQVVQSIVRANSPQEKSYSARVLLYCRSAHVQAMLDEYAYLVSTALPQSQPEKLPKKFLPQLARVLGMGTGSPSVNVLTRRGKICQRPSPRPAHFALAFGDDVVTDTTEVGGRTRKTAMREAFNSPFWPFVLATTSVGQEGLDFHLYCRDIMHWNLPSNPVDLEQREGRINRFDCLSIRRAIVSDHPLSALVGVAPDQKNIWARLFELLRLHPSGTQRFKHGLYPHWIYQPAKEDGQMLRRHLAFYSRSRDALRYEDLKDALRLYRLVLGQPRQQDIIESLLKMFPEANPSDIGKALVKYTINLSPIPKGHAARMAEQEARELIRDPQRLSQTLEEVRHLAEQESTGQLQPVTKEIRDLVQLASDGGGSPGAAPAKRIQAIAALLYLLNPYDDLYDFHDGIGYQDDIAQIRQVHASLFAQPDPKHEIAGTAKDLRIDLTPPKCA
jgi:hypothetical protein